MTNYYFDPEYDRIVDETIPKEQYKILCSPFHAVSYEEFLKCNFKNVDEFNNKRVDVDEFEAFELCEDVEKVECLGASSSHSGLKWYSVEFKDGKSIDIFYEY